MPLLYDKLSRVAGGDLLEWLKRAVVFDVTNVVPILQDWENERIHPISKRPPYRECFFEWTGPYEFSDGSSIIFRQAALIQQVPMLDPRLPAAVTNIMEAMRDERGFTEWYWVNTFGEENGRLHVGVAPSLCGGTEGFLQCQIFNIAVPADCIPKTRRMDVMYSELTLADTRRTLGERPPVRMVESTGHSSVAFMACALLHCRNISTSTTYPPPKLQRATRKRGYPPLSSYKTLTLELPGSSSVSRDPSNKRGTIVRGHMVRGHFKNLQHGRFKEKGWHWWPAHWRGDGDAFVSKEYKLVPLKN